MKKSALSVLFGICLVSAPLCAQNALLIRPADLRLVPENGGGFESASGYHLYIRKLPGVESVMLTETTKDPAGREDNYAYRALEYNSVNGDEIRYLDGKALDSPNARYSLIDSTAESDPVFGQAFHIYIPRRIQFGYPWTRNGVVTIGRGTFLNIRAFARKYADYAGGFYDNPYMFDLGKAEKKAAPLPPPAPEPEAPEEKAAAEDANPVLTDDYNPVAGEKFHEVSDFLTYSRGPDTIVDDVMASIGRIPSNGRADVVFVIDATGSMKDDIEKLRNELVPRMMEKLSDFRQLRLGLLLYRDYGDNFRYKGIPVKFFDFTDDVGIFVRNLNSFKILGREGGDIPEAVYEGLYGGIEFYAWNEDAVRKIILIGDAEPHPIPRGTGKYTKELVMKLAAEKNIQIDAIITPDDKSRRGR